MTIVNKRHMVRYGLPCYSNTYCLLFR